MAGIEPGALAGLTGDGKLECSPLHYKRWIWSIAAISGQLYTRNRYVLSNGCLVDALTDAQNPA